MFQFILSIIINNIFFNYLSKILLSSIIVLFDMKDIIQKIRNQTSNFKIYFLSVMNNSPDNSEKT